MTSESSNQSPSPSDVCTFAILVDGREIAGEFHVLTISVAAEVNRIPKAVIHLRDGEASRATFEASNSDHFIPGKDLEIQLGYRSQNTAVFKGIVVKHSVKIRKNGSILIVECRDPAVKMTRGMKNRYFSDQKDSEIMEEIIDAYGLQHEISTTVPDLKAVVQYEATDWDFLLCRCEANGHVLLVEDGKVKTMPVNTGEEPVITIEYGTSLLELDAEMDARRQSVGITASAWNSSDQELIEAEAEEPSTTETGNISHSDLAEIIGGEADLIRHTGKLCQQELQAWANGRLLKERMAKVRGRAKFQGFAEIFPGRIMTLDGIGERFEGNVYVTGVRHLVANGNWETDVQFGLDTELFAETFDLRPLPAAGLLPAVSGLQIGVVTMLENDPDGEDRIKVKMPIINNQEEGVWARIATLDAGNERGTFFRPEINDEVVVGFLDNDPRQPIVLGMCHSSAKPAPEQATDGNHRKGIVSREKLQLVFDDEKKAIFIETPEGNKLTLNEEDQTLLIEDQHGNKITLDDNGIKIESSKDLMLEAAGDIKLEGVNMDMAAQSAFKAAGTSSAEVSGASTTIKGSANTVIQGGLVQIN